MLLYEAIRGQEETFKWNKETKEVFNDLKLALLSTPAHQALPDVTKPSHLFVDKSQGIAKGGDDTKFGTLAKFSGLVI